MGGLRRPRLSLRAGGAQRATLLVTWQKTPLSCTDCGTQSEPRDAADCSTAPSVTREPWNSVA